MRDKYQRKIEYMRLSITDSCNFRCQYCIPDGTKLSHHLMSVDDIRLIANGLKPLGINKIKLTGGEPLMHPNIIEIVDVLKNECGIEQVTLTTNGALLHQYLADFERLKLDGITISIDTIDRDAFNDLVRREQYDIVIANIKAAQKSSIKNIKLNCVPLKARGDNNLVELCHFANSLAIPLRFIEVMPIGYGRRFPGYDHSTILDILNQNFGKSKIHNEKLGNGPASYYCLEHLTAPVGIISAVSNKFCESCNKIRVTSTGHLKQCLHYNYNIDLIDLLNSENGIQEIKKFITEKPKEHAFSNEEINKNEIETLTMSEIGG